MYVLIDAKMCIFNQQLTKNRISINPFTFKFLQFYFILNLEYLFGIDLYVSTLFTLFSNTVQCSFLLHNKMSSKYFMVILLNYMD